MDLLFTLAIALAASWMAKRWMQQQRVALLARYLSGKSIEKDIERLNQGYLRALGEADPARGEQVLAVLRTTEQSLCRQVREVASAFAAADPVATRVSLLPVWLPFTPAVAGTFDMREALRVHAQGICRAVDQDSARSAKDRAFAISAEMLLMQHTCHWFCRSRSVASARLLAHHRTSYEQVVDSILPQTRSDYLRLVSRGRAA